MNKRANLYFAALLGAMSPLSTVTALAAQSNSMIATATQQQNSCKGTVTDASGEPIRRGCFHKRRAFPAIKAGRQSCVSRNAY